MPDDNASSGADVEGVLGAELRNLDAAIGSIDHLLMHPFDLVAEDDGVARTLFNSPREGENTIRTAPLALAGRGVRGEGIQHR